MRFKMRSEAERAASLPQFFASALGLGKHFERMAISDEWNVNVAVT